MMTGTGSSSGSLSDPGAIRPLLTDALHIAGYHLKDARFRIADRSDNVCFVHGYRVSDKTAVVAKVSTNSLQIEREYHIIRQLYQTADGPLYLVRPLECAHLSGGLAAAIYADAEHDEAFETIDDIGTFLRLAIRCTDILEFIHRHNTVHGQINMEAFCWGSEEVRLWNFAGGGGSGSGSGSLSFEKYLTSQGWRKYQSNRETLQNRLMYISPEQTGRTTYSADHRADIYSLGIVFFVLLTGQLPFDGGPLEIVNNIISRKMTAVHDIQLNVPETVSHIIEKMTCKAPDDRYMSMHGVRCDLAECLQRLTAGGSGTIAPFPLAQHDIASVFMIPRNVYGRQPIISEMIFIVERFVSQYRPTRIRSRPGTLETRSISDPEAEQRSASSRSYHGYDSPDVSSTASSKRPSNGRQATTIVGIYGPGGIGKSTLFNVVQPLARKSGYIASSKFDSRNKVPYSGLLNLLGEVLKQVLSEPEEEVGRFYDHLKTCLGAQFSNIMLLADMVPELSSLLVATGDKENHTTKAEARHNALMKADNVEARLRFHNLYVEVFRAIGQWRMVTLFIDDLHQADDPSIELLLALMISRISLLIFVSYRDEEINERQSVLLENEFANIHFIEIRTLEMDAIIDFVSDTLHRPRDADRSYVMPLAEVIHRKTNGNAFYTAQLLRMLERKKLIYFNWEFNVWEYDIERIEQGTFLETMQADVSFMVARLRELPRHGRQLLKLASFVGDTFSWSTVKALMAEPISEDESEDGSSEGDRSSVFSGDTMTDLTQFSGRSKRSTDTAMTPTESRASTRCRTYDPISGLHTVIQEGYVMPIGDDRFKWSHDRITQAAGELANLKTRCKIHFKIAQHIMQEKNVDYLLAADHLLKCLDLVQAAEDKRPYRELLINAGNKGRQSGAHGMALSYYKAAIDLSDPEEEWNDENYETTLHLYINAMALSFVRGNYDATEKLMAIIFKHAKCALDRKTAYLIHSRCCLAQQMQFKGRDTLLAGLQDLGNEVIIFDDVEKTMAQEYRRLEVAIERIGLEEVANIGMSEDPYLHATMDIMEELVHLLYWTGEKYKMCTYACRVLNMCLERGMSPSASVACGFAGVGYSELDRDYASGERLGRLGMTLADRYGGNYEKGRSYWLYGIFFNQFKNHHREALTIFQSGMQYGISAGDRYFEQYNHLHSGACMLSLGYHLSDALAVAEDCFDDVHKWSASMDTNVLSMSIVRTIKALQGRTYWEKGCVFDGDDGFTDEHFLTESCSQSPNPDVALNWYQSYKMIPLVLYEHYDSAIEVGRFCLRTINAHLGMRHTRVALVYYSLALIARARRDSETKDACIRRVRANQDILYDWVISSRINYVMLWTLVEAELANLEGIDVVKTVELYEDAINQAREGDWYLELCLSHEYAGQFYNRRGMRNLAYSMIKKAVDLYTSLGAFGKARHLNSKHADLLSGLKDERSEIRDKGAQTDPFPLLAVPYQPQPTWSNSSHDHAGTGSLANEPYDSEMIPPVTTEQTLVTLDIIDMASILKSSQVLSSEVKSEALLRSMMHIIMQNSGAERGAIIVKEEGFGIGAYGNQQDDEPITTYDQLESISKDSQLVSSQVIHHTIHTAESIFIADVEQDARFAVGPWYERAGKKSVICMPIIHNTTTVGCLFIEGAVGIFTQRHITVLGLLCQQMGISLTNASLFKSVQRVTTANIRMIEMQKQALEEARRSKEAADKATRLREIFLANMSHEIRTPFSGFYGMISLLAETKLDPEQYDLVRTAKSSCEGLLQIIDDLLNFSKLQAGKVSLDLAPVYLEELIADVTDMLIAIAIQKRINVTYLVAKDVPSVIMADANRLRQIIINLLGNAIKFTHHGEIIIRCSLDSRKVDEGIDDSQVPLLFEVVDTGIGISEEQRKVLFIPFSQVDGSTTRKYGGTGLGLSICLQLVSLMGGEIDVVSNPGHGSNFRFSILVSAVQDQTREFNEAMQMLSNSLTKTRVLVADTHRSTGTMMSHFLPDHLPLDSVSDYTELQQETPYGVVIVGLLLAHKEGTLSSWENELQKIMRRAKLTLVMHYPLGSDGNFENEEDIIPAAIALQQQQRSQQQLQQPFRTPAHLRLGREQTIVRMAVPLRREKLLRILAGFLQQDDEDQMQSSSKTPRPGSRPVAFARVSSSEIKQAIETIPDEHRHAFLRMNILVAEDNPVAQKLLQKQLNRYGFNVTCANNGAEAIDSWTEQPTGYFRMAFFDHHMPKCDGVEATKTIRKTEARMRGKGRRLPIVALTADIQESARDICVNAGMDGYLTKPLNEFALLEFIKQYCIDR